MYGQHNCDNTASRHSLLYFGTHNVYTPTEKTHTSREKVNSFLLTEGMGCAVQAVGERCVFFFRKIPENSTEGQIEMFFFIASNALETCMCCEKIVAVYLPQSLLSFSVILGV